MVQDVTLYSTANPSFHIEEKAEGMTHAVLSIEPLEQGYGHTLGNALRRVLLSSLPGSAITSVRIQGVDHQYTTLEGMSEDVVELILNLKQLRIKADADRSGVLRLNVTGAKEVTGADIEAEAGFEVVNPELHIASLAKGKSLVVEMTVEPGNGYVMAADRKSNIIGEIPLDALFSPVVKVSYQVEATRVGRRTDYDRLILDIQTDGTLSPMDALKQSAKILARQFTQVFDPVMSETPTEDSKLSPEEAEVLKLTVEELDLPTRIANALRKGGFKTVGDLVGAPRNTVAKVKNLGEKSVDVINEALMKKGVTLGE
ncbi:MAG TPA: DNA-directed RNA polymerase subunit alpha [Vitreimonas sp.]|nr:DNA-directed RNA polymerase subunit alpha [Vitreimonas sp.]